MKQNPKKAFTLVELIVVITILAILGTIAFISLQGYSKSSRDSVRISDVSNMKTSLELFHLNAGKYPLPDDDETVSYSGETLWYQGTFGSEVVSQLSRNMSEVPTNPLTDKEYIFSTANNKNEFEILTLLESDLALNTISQTNAAILTVVPKVDGNYNGVFIKTSKNIVPTPSIITSEDLGVGFALTNTNIKSQVINLGKNIPNIGNVNSDTEQLTGLELIEIPLPPVKPTDTEKASVITSIQEAYTGSTDLANTDIYEYILSVSGESELAAVFDTVVLNDGTAVSDTGAVVPVGTVAACENTVGVVIYGTDDGFADQTDLLTCTDDIIVCNGTTGSGIIIAACNQGTSTVYIDQTFTGTTAPRDESINEWAGGLYQWGNNAELSRTPSIATLITSTALVDSTYDVDTNFILGSSSYRYDWIEIQNDDLWGNGTDTDLARIGPCAVGYHIPTQLEWAGIHTAGGWGSNGVDSGINMSNALKMPMAGELHRASAGIYDQGLYGEYWSSSPSGSKGYHMYFNSTNIIPNLSHFRSYGYSVRCFKN